MGELEPSECTWSEFITNPVDSTWRKYFLLWTTPPPDEVGKISVCCVFQLPVNFNFFQSGVTSDILFLIFPTLWVNTHTPPHYRLLTLVKSYSYVPCHYDSCTHNRPSQGSTHPGMLMKNRDAPWCILIRESCAAFRWPTESHDSTYSHAA